MAAKPPLKVAIIHDWLVGGGAELVVEQLHLMFPDAPIFTSYATDEWRARLNGQVKTGWLQRLGKIRKYLPILRILWFTNLDFRGYDLVISSSGAEAKGIRVPQGTTHINYCHAPTHYYWSRYEAYLKHPGFGIFDWLARFGLKLLVNPLRRWDYAAAQRPDVMIANSSHIQAEIKKYYDRESIVIHPPVNIERFQKLHPDKQRQGFVIAGRQTPYKRFDLAVKACSQLNLPLTVIGDGPEDGRLRRIAGPSIRFLGKVPNEILEKEFSRASAFLFPGLDDFGITPVEAMAAGLPVLAYKAGGATDYVSPGKTGEFFETQTVASLSESLQHFDSKRYTVTSLRAKAAEFSSATFKKKLQLVIDETLNDLKIRS